MIWKKSYFSLAHVQDKTEGSELMSYGGNTDATHTGETQKSDSVTVDTLSDTTLR